MIGTTMEFHRVSDHLNNYDYTCSSVLADLTAACSTISYHSII